LQLHTQSYSDSSDYQKSENDNKKGHPIWDALSISEIIRLLKSFKRNRYNPLRQANRMFPYLVPQALPYSVVYLQSLGS